MIFYFSGTGNSLYAAKSIAKHNKERLISISSEMKNRDSSISYDLQDNETVGFVFPVYAWGPPKQVIQFIQKLILNNYNNNYTYSVVTCGGNIGNTMKVLKGALEKRKLSLHSGFSVVMPNNYIIMGNIDSKENQEKRLLEAEKTLEEINKVIESRQKDVFKTIKGAMPSLLTGVINPLFNKGAANTEKFYAKDNCTGCGICESVCNCNSIKVNGKPSWGKECSQCLACIHLCPVKAIEYGKGTEKKGRYKNPKITIDEMKVNRTQ